MQWGDNYSVGMAHKFLIRNFFWQWKCGSLTVQPWGQWDRQKEKRKEEKTAVDNQTLSSILLLHYESYHKARLWTYIPDQLCFMVSHLDNSNLSQLQNKYFVKSELSPYIFPLHTVKHSTVNITVYCNFYSLLHYLLLPYLGNDISIKKSKVILHNPRKNWFAHIW